MQQLINIQTSSINSELIQTVNARDLHSFLESKQQFADWIKNRIEQYNFVENEDFVRLHKKMKANNATAIEYHITLDMAKELSMVERNAKGKEARQYFIECEKKVIQRDINPIQASLMILEFATKHLRLAPSGVLGGLQNIQQHYHLPNTLPNYAVDAASDSGHESSEVTHSLTHLLKKHDVDISIHKAYAILEDMHLVERKTRKSSNGEIKKFWALTDEGLKFGKNVTDPKYPRQTQPHFFDSRFEELQSEMFLV